MDKKMKLRGKLMIMALLPVIALGFLTYFAASAKIRQAIEDQAFEGMQETTRTIREIFDTMADGEYHIDESGQLWKGEELNLSSSTELVDSIKEKTEFDVTVFYGDERVLTTLKDTNGNRQTGTKAQEAISSQVLNSGQEYQSNHTEIFGKRYICYYIPLYQSGTQTPVGMIFIGKEYTKIEEKIQSVLLSLLLVMLVVLAIVCITSILVAGGIASSVKEAISYVNQMSQGKLGIKASQRLMDRKDELGDMCRSVKQLDNDLSEVIAEIQMQSHELEETSVLCNGNAHKALNSAEQINTAAEEVAAATSTQAQEAVEAENNVHMIGQTIEETYERMQGFSDTSRKMAEAAENARRTLTELNSSMSQVKEAVANIHHQTNETHSSVEKIGEMTAVITSIASQTNMLSLNASIEAARAGEMGKGFAVVAEEIRKLAEQCNKSAVEIQEVLTQLKNNSSESVKTMEDVETIIQEQENKLMETNQVFEMVEGGIDQSQQGIENIMKEIDTLNAARSSTVAGVQNVSTLAQQNAASIEETAASIDEVTGLLSVMTDKIDGLKHVADKLEEKASVFQIS